MSIVTKQGDAGKTRLFSGEEVSKADARVEIYGTLDELVAHLGFARSQITDAELSREVRELEIDLFRIGVELASNSPEKQKWVEPTEARHIAWIDARIERIEKRIVLPRSFLVPGTCLPSAALEVARAVARRLERRVAQLADDGGYANPCGVIYINRLSDYLFLLARAVEVKLGIMFDVK